MGFQKGKPKTGGRQIGTPNGLTGAFKEAVRIVYEGLGGHANFLKWARKNQGEYYKIASRLIPGEMQDPSGREPIRVFVYGPEGGVRGVPPALADHSREEE